MKTKLNLSQVMSDSDEIKKYDQNISLIKGKSIKAVRYFEIDYGQESFDEGLFHSLDYGLEMEFVGGGNVYFIWDHQFHIHDLKFSMGDMSSEFCENHGAVTHDVSKHPSWHGMVNQEIIGLRSLRNLCSAYKDLLSARRYYRVYQRKAVGHFGNRNLGGRKAKVHGRSYHCFL